jgi:hypothetical protein
MSALKLTKSQKPFAEYVRFLENFCKENNLTMELRELGFPTYQIAKLTGDGVRLVVYPHKTTTNNVHTRIRNEGSTDIQRCQQLMETSGLPIKLGALE